jgi:N-methylhydantoinase B
MTTLTADTKKMVRDMSHEEMESAYSCDRFTAGVLSSRMRYVVQHMCAGLLNNAFATILRDWFDFSASIVGAADHNYPLSAVSNSMSSFIGHMAESVRVTVEEYGRENLHPGDVIIGNDPYRIGNHVNDICFTRPVFHEGRIVAFVSMKAHQLDLGGSIPAGFSAMTKNVFEGGLVLPPTLLFDEDKPVRSTFSLISDNSRFGSLLLPDMMSIYQQLKLGERLLLESIERYGVDAFVGAMLYSCDVSADAMREAIATKLPDGVYEGEDFIDADGVDDSREYVIKVRITKYGENVELDLSGTSEQARTCINGGPFDTKSASIVALKMLLDQRTPITSGSFRNIDLVVPPGTICSAAPPDGAIFLYYEGSIGFQEGIYRALADALGAEAIGGDYGDVCLHNGSGVHADGTPWVSVAQCGGEHGPWGATKAGDGDSYQVVHIGNNLDPATEAIEAEVPVVVLRKEYVVDTGGPGENRGGAAVMKDVLWLEDAEHWLTPTRSKQPTGIGAYGGGEGTALGVWIWPPSAYDIGRDQNLAPTGSGAYADAIPVAGVLDPKTHELDRDGRFYYHGTKDVWRTEEGSTFRYLTGGGGGWGDALTRDPERVMRDVRDEYISIETAARDYGVVVLGDPKNDPEGLTIDVDATRGRRMELSEQREQQ